MKTYLITIKKSTTFLNWYKELIGETFIATLASDVYPDFYNKENDKYIVETIQMTEEQGLLINVNEMVSGFVELEDAEVDIKYPLNN